MINIATQTKWYSEKARALNAHVKGMRSIIMIPVIEKRIQVNEAKIKAFGRHRILRENRQVEESFLNLNTIMLKIATSVRNAYICRGGVKHASKKQE